MAVFLGLTEKIHARHPITLLNGRVVRTEFEYALDIAIAWAVS